MIKRGIEYLVGFSGVIYLFMTGVVVSAESNVNFSVEAIPNEFQVDSGVTYFDLRIPPEQRTDMKIRIYNHGSDDQSYLVSLRNATTNGNGLIVYEEKGPLTLAEVSLSELARVSEKPITIKAGESKIVSLKLTLPKRAIEGVLLAGIEIKKQDKPEEASAEVGVQSRQAYVIGVKVRSSIREIEPDLLFEGVKATSYLSRPSVLVTLANQAPAISEKFQVEAVVKKGGKVIVRKEMTAQFAPTTYMTFPLTSMGILKPGTYQLDVKVIGKEKNWTWQDDFTISEKQVEQMKKTVPDVEQHPNSFLGDTSKMLMIVSLSIIVLLLGYIYHLKRKASSE
ncbi:MULTISPECIES: DUF916 and DUF3324 domain-containing protein [unclassified Exiguobacterium]|uniref:DUF916 and DUF3324 domain-containing protein n=1 Tax=unclassified Exiguobacterium TaxID=2644629 RepID=UPI001BE92007|nr:MULTISPECIES: DUF916 and DUF3324 domain-containing protein [unclassified Exiguobacterium]